MMSMKKLSKIAVFVLLSIFPLAISAAHAGKTMVISESSTFQDVVFSSEKPYAAVGTSVTKGDFNKDGIDDFAISAVRETAPRITDEVGMVSVFLGSTSLNTLPLQVKIGKASDSKESARLYGPVEPAYTQGNFVGSFLFPVI
ncbi:MAG: FG-GAP repeat protein [Desulfobacterales bacterium]